MRACTFAVALLVCPRILQWSGNPCCPTRAGIASGAGLAPGSTRGPLQDRCGIFRTPGARSATAQNVTIRFTSRQLNDVLKSLTTIDPQGQVTGISYNSVAPLDQRLGALRLPLGPAGTAFDVLASLRGARVEVTAAVRSSSRDGFSGSNGRSTTGATREREVQEFSILTDAGDVRSYELSPAVSVRVIDREMRQEIGRYLDVIGSTREQDVRNMVISTTGSGERPLFVSYVSEVPVWKSTYRLVIPSAGAPFLQGWAVIDNTIGEDWTGVELSLVAGSPQSFIQQISQPYYTKRPIVPLPAHMLMTPQTHDPALRGADEPIAFSRIVSERDRRWRRGGRARWCDGRSRRRASRCAGAAASIRPARETSSQRRSPATSAICSSTASRSRSRCEKNQSALVPIVNAAIGVEKVSLWNRGGERPPAARGLADEHHRTHPRRRQHLGDRRKRVRRAKA